jgi:hypothetical protein
MGVALFEALVRTRRIAVNGDDVHLTRRGEAFLQDFGIVLPPSRRPPCLSCLDWSQRRFHLAGAVGAGLLERFTALGWATRDRKSRAVIFSKSGETKFARLLAS